MSNKEIIKLKKRIAKGDLNTKLELARCYVWHNETKPVPPKKAEKAVRYLKDCIKHSNALAMHSLGAMYYMGRGVPQDYTKAIKWYKKAVDKGEHWANNNLGYCYYYGKSVPVDYEKALQCIIIKKPNTIFIKKLKKVTYLKNSLWKQLIKDLTGCE